MNGSSAMPLNRSGNAKAPVRSATGLCVVAFP